MHQATRREVVLVEDSPWGVKIVGRLRDPDLIKVVEQRLADRLLVHQAPSLDSSGNRGGSVR